MATRREEKCDGDGGSCGNDDAKERRKQACKLRDGANAKTKFIIDSDVCESHDLETANRPH